MDPESAHVLPLQVHSRVVQASHTAATHTELVTQPRTPRGQRLVTRSEEEAALLCQFSSLSSPHMAARDLRGS